MMYREKNPVWKQCLATVEPMLESIGFSLASETNHYAAFGSASVEYVRSDMRVQLGWDGKESWITAVYEKRDRNERHIRGEQRTLEIAAPASNPARNALAVGRVADEFIAHLTSALHRIATTKW